MARCQSSSLVSRNELPVEPPTLLTRTSTAPNAGERGLDGLPDPARRRDVGGDGDRLDAERPHLGRGRVERVLAARAERDPAALRARAPWRCRGRCRGSRP